MELTYTVVKHLLRQEILAETKFETNQNSCRLKSFPVTTLYCQSEQVNTTPLPRGKISIKIA